MSMTSRPLVSRGLLEDLDDFLAGLRRVEETEAVRRRHVCLGFFQDFLLQRRQPLVSGFATVAQFFPAPA